MRFRFGNLNEDFDVLVNAISIVKKKCKPDWNVADIINSIYTGKATFVVSKINNSDVGVFHLTTEAYTNEKVLWIWAAYSSETNQGFELYLDDWKTLATELDCKAIMWDSNRPGYLRSLKRLKGTNVRRIEYKINL